MVRFKLNTITPDSIDVDIGISKMFGPIASTRRSGTRGKCNDWN